MKKGIITFLSVLLCPVITLYFLSEMNGSIFFAIFMAIAVGSGFIVAEIEKLIGVNEQRNQKSVQDTKE